MKWFIHVLCFFCFGQLVCHGQERNAGSWLELYWDNDVMNIIGKGTDRYYTNGLRFSVHSFGRHHKRSFADALLFSFRQDTVKRYTWGIMQAMCTPENISSKEPGRGDWPYAGSLFAVHSVSSVSKDGKTCLKAEILAGVLGSWSFAGETQRFVHRLIGSVVPEGWGSQISNYPLVNYNLSVEPVLYKSRFFDVTGSAELNAGSLVDQLRTGATVRLGKRRDVFRPGMGRQFFFEYAISGGYVLYNAMLEGGFFDQKGYREGRLKGYRLNGGEIARSYLENQFSAHMIFNRIGFVYRQKYRTRQTRDTKPLSVGNVTVLVTL